MLTYWAESFWTNDPSNRLARVATARPTRAISTTGEPTV